MGVFDIFDKTKTVFNNSEISQTKFSQAKNKAQLKKLKEAIKIAEEIKKLWKKNPSWREQLVRDFTIKNLLSEVDKQLTSWKMQLQRAESLASQGKALMELDKNDPFDSTIITQALDFFTKSNQLFYETEYVVKEQILKDKIDSRNRFQSLYNEGKNQKEKGYYQQGLSYLLQAEKIYKSVTVTTEIRELENLIQLQIEYDNTLIEAKSLAQQGEFIKAQNKLQLMLAKFSRQDGEELKQKLDTIINAKSEYRQGLLAEKIDNLSLAKKQYQLALSHLPSLDSANYRLAIIYIRENNYSSALSCLEKLTGENVNYLRGFCYLQKNDWEKVIKEWRQIHHPLVNQQKEDLKTLIQRNRLQIIQQIENLVNEEKYQEAKNSCENFIQKYGYNANIEANLNRHIKPALQRQLWQSFDLITIINQLEKEFKHNPTITNLHNISIALYYQAQIDKNYLEKWIAVWATGLVNIQQNPILQNIVWLGSNPIDYEKTKQELIKIVENTIDKYKDNNLNKYYQLRDIFRREMLAIELMGNPPNAGVKIQEIFITPAFYQQHKSQLKNVTLTKNNLGMLFTHWGLAVSACLKNDIERGIKIKPNLTPLSEVEKFAYQLVNYYEGCYHLQNNSWKKAKTCLQKAQTEIKNNQDWIQEINRLCEKQRQKIEDFNEHLQFAQFWYDLLKSSQSASYLAEYKAREISQQVADEKLSFSQAINKLKEVQKIDYNNALVVDLMSRLEYSIEAQEIDRLMKQNRFEDAVRKAKYSSNREIKHLVASICIEIALNGAKAKELDWETLQQLGRWAYEICPYEPDFREIYKALRII
ncbi:peptidase M, neutral zinc metallopeptidase, zinc-binding site [Geminocystis sp. GBBB08]|uniref:tetratricopeptide repeat protein n=1 Tax=Geminocystis sp. GBBB08 TaxID=2604140 RepID=UPI0027E375BA|nr:peptidase M, neutral zinc metallopeptidase, zinc-binding site [Geminocystis sp. GBBB08]MBL1210639.1 peptidase M, neutral zinc metallopeptidase, zinc-binding site [Geminocystis sp. GBBB08]